MSDVGVSIRCDRSELEAAKRTILELQDKKIRIKFDTQDAVAPLRREIDKLKNQKISLKIDTQRGVSAIDRQIMQLKNKITAIKLNPNMGTTAVNNLSREINKISGKKIELQFDLAKLKNDIYGTTADMADKLTAAFNKKWGTNVSKNEFGGLNNIDQVINKIELLDASMRKVQHRKISIQLDAKAKIDEINAEIQKLTARKNKLKLEAELDRKQIDSQISSLEQQKREIEMRAKAQTAELDKKLAEEQNKTRWINFKMRLQGYADVYNKVQSLTSRLGSTTVSLGNALTRMTSPVNTIMRGAMYRVGYGAINKLYEGFGGAFERYDTMHTYATVMKELGYSAESSNKAIQELEQSVLGLPTGLDEIVAAQRTYVSASGDMEKATKMAIAANNAFISGGLDETRKRFSERQLQNLMSGADLTAMQWDSLRKNMPLAMQAVARELGYAKKDSGKMVTDLKQGNLEADKFVTAFIKVGNEGTIAKAAQVMKTTFTGLTANINNAARRMGTNIIETLDDVMKKSTGRNLIQTLLGVDENGNDMGDGIKHFIDNISKSVQGWIKANPEKIIGFMDKIKSYDWKGLLSGMAQGFMEAGRWATKFVGVFSRLSSTNLGKWMVKLNMLGRLLQVASMGLRGLSPAFGIFAVLTKFASKTKVISRVGEALKGFFSAKLFGNVAKGAAQAKTAASAMSGTGTAMAKALTGWDVASKLATAVQIGAGGWAIKQVLEGISEIGDIKISKDIVATIGLATGAIGALTGFATMMGNAMTALGPLGIVGGAVGGGVTWLAGDAISRVMKAVKDMADGVKTLSEVEPLREKRINTIIDSVKKVAPKIKELYKTFRDSMQGKDGNGTVSDGSTISKYVKNMGDALEGVSDFDKLVKDVSKLKLDAPATNKAILNIGKVKRVYSKLQASIAELFNTQYSEREVERGGRGRGKVTTSHKYNKVETDDIENYKEYLQGMTESLGLITASFDHIKSFNDKVKEMLKDKTLEKGDDPYKKITDRMNQFGTFLSDITKDEASDSFMNSIKNASNRLKDVKMSQLNDVFEKVSNVFTNVMKFDKKLKGSVFDTIKGGGSDDTEAYEPLLRRMRSFGSFIKQLNLEGGLFSTLKEVHKNLEDVDMGQINTVFDKLKNTIKRMTELEKSMTNTMFGGRDTTGMSKADAYDARVDQNMSADIFNEHIGKLTESIKKISDGLNEIPENVPDKSAAIANIRKSIKSLKQAVRTINNGKGLKVDSSAIDKALEQLKEVGNKIKNFKFGAGNVIVKTIKVEVKADVNTMPALMTFITKMVALGASIKNFKANYSKRINVRVTANVPTGAVTSYISSQIRQAVANAQSVYHKSISINVSTNITNTVTETLNRVQRENLIRAGASGVAKADSRRVATGGMIGNHGILYRANGGSILGTLFKPKGTDIVPAMLTPGEYVVRKRAVSYFGAKFMQKINNLDIAGAMKDLSIRTGNNLAQGSTTIINHNDNRVDNRKVVQNFSGGTNERTGYMRANRYLMGLR